MAEQATPRPVDDVDESANRTDELPPDGLLIAALARAQAAFPMVPKTKTATVTSAKGNYTYNYADLADVLAAVRPILAGEGLAILQKTQYDANGELHLFTRLRHVAGGTEESDVILAQGPNAPQQFGAALTYLRRYELVTLLGIQADEDTDAEHVDGGNGRAAPPALPGWAAPASEARSRELGRELGYLIGPERTRKLSAATRDTFGAVPDVIVGFTKALAAHLRSELAEELEAKAEDRRAAAEAARAQAAAEQPDQPAPEPDQPVDEDEAGPSPEELEALRAHQAGAVEEGAPGSVPMPNLDGLDDDERRQAIREAGCVCPDPISGKDADHVDECPIQGHGIPF